MPFSFAEDLNDDFIDGEILTSLKLNRVKTTINSKQDKIYQKCESGQSIAEIKNDGSVVCEIGGAGSGLNADSLDGIDSSGFAASSQTCAGGVMIGIDSEGKIICEQSIYFFVAYISTDSVGESTEGSIMNINFAQSENAELINNIGESYHMEKGEFVAPRSGVYNLEAAIGVAPVPPQYGGNGGEFYISIDVNGISHKSPTVQLVENKQNIQRVTLTIFMKKSESASVRAEFKGNLIQVHWKSVGDIPTYFRGSSVNNVYIPEVAIESE